MKNKIITGLVLLFCLTFVNISNAQRSAPDIGFKKGDVEIALGVGLMNTFVGKNTEAPLPPLSLSVNYRFQQSLSVGGYLGYSRTNYVPSENDIDDPNFIAPELTNNYFQVGARFGGHFTQGRVDFYGGAMVGYNFSVNESDNIGEDGRIQGIIVEDFDDIVIFSGHVGAKYLLTEHFGIFGEVGYGVSLINLGLTSRF